MTAEEILLAAARCAANTMMARQHLSDRHPEAAETHAFAPNDIDVLIKADGRNGITWKVVVWLSDEQVAIISNQQGALKVATTDPLVPESPVLTLIVAALEATERGLTVIEIPPTASAA